jgi:hypothetical protein
MEFEMIAVISLALLFFIGIIYLIVKERNKDRSEVHDIPLWAQDSKPPIKKGRTK